MHVNKLNGKGVYEFIHRGTAGMGIRGLNNVVKVENLVYLAGMGIIFLHCSVPFEHFPLKNNGLSIEPNVKPIHSATLKITSYNKA